MRISFILVKPRNPQNIGAAARAMGNFGFEDLRLVNPWDPTWQEAKSAVGASPILKKAKVFNSIEEAVKDANILIATTALKNRKPFQQILTLNKIDTFFILLWDASEVFYVENINYRFIWFYWYKSIGKLY